jgi:hypothetical protein
MSEKKSSLLDERIAQFFESSTELLTDLHARNKAAATKGTSKKKRGKRKTTSLPKPDIDSHD